MKSRLRLRPESGLRTVLLLAALALGGCAPSSYDGLSGGSKEDENLAAPRQVSPISVSLIASKRPRLRWDLGLTLTGAVVEMSRTREFDKEVKTFAAKGSEMVVPEDLELGIWFWRLKGDASGSVGTRTSAVWEMLVRGPAAHGSSDTPTGALVDMNGDGEPDLILAGTVSDVDEKGNTPLVPQGPTAQEPAPGMPGTPPATGPLLMLYNGDRERGLVEGDAVYFGPSAYEGPISLGGGTDFNGDGLTDLIHSGIIAGVYENKPFYGVDLVPGSADKKLTFDLDRSEALYLRDQTTLPTVHEGADVDGDGFGDAVIGVRDTGFLVLGVSPGGHSPFLPVYPTEPGAGSRIAMGGFDANGDGLADVAFSLSDEYAPNARAFVAPGNRSQRIGEATRIDGPDAQRATAFAAGDFNGDGIDDLAITTPVNDSSRVCIWFGSREKLVVQGPCVMAAPGDTDFGASLTAGDLEGDGTDELLATTRSGGVDGVRVVRIGGDGAAAATPIGLPGLGVSLTTIWPGRPGKARWAAVASDGSSIGIFEGADLRMSLPPPPGVIRGFGRGLR